MTGFVLVDKPPGPTSHDVVDAVRKVFGVRRVGHAGTLDPPASGLLVVAVGPSTRLLSYVQELPKTYEATAQLGIRTTTLDASGEEVSRSDVDVTVRALREAASGFVGEIEQVPPVVSAVKIGGERAYRKARRGEDVELAPRRVTVYSFDVPRSSADAFDARIVCSSGTYVRSLIADVGDKLGCGAHVVHLRRIAIGHLSVVEAVALGDIGKVELIPADKVLAHLPRVEVDAAIAEQA
ncbi:MAG: tRNA pseudouridine(55) synthase TruB, partial [Actinomycetota bacterium]